MRLTFIHLPIKRLIDFEPTLQIAWKTIVNVWRGYLLRKATRHGPAAWRFYICSGMWADEWVIRLRLINPCDVLCSFDNQFSSTFWTTAAAGSATVVIHWVSVGGDQRSCLHVICSRQEELSSARVCRRFINSANKHGLVDLTVFHANLNRTWIFNWMRWCGLVVTRTFIYYQCCCCCCC